MIKDKIEQPDLIEYSNWALIKDIGKFLKPYKGRFIAASIFRIISDLSGLYLAYGFALIVTFFSKYSQGESLKYFWMILIVLCFAYFLNFIFRYFAASIGYKWLKRQLLMRKLK